MHLPSECAGLFFAEEKAQYRALSCISFHRHSCSHYCTWVLKTLLVGYGKDDIGKHSSIMYLSKPQACWFGHSANTAKYFVTNPTASLMEHLLKMFRNVWHPSSNKWVHFPNMTW